MSSDDNGRTVVTMRVLNDKLDALRWELRFLIVAAMVGGPAAGKAIGTQVATAATRLVGH